MKLKLHHWFSLFALFAGIQPGTAQPTMFTYQGRVLDNGTNFTGTGLFEFALVTSTNLNPRATATATMGGSSPHEFVNSFNLISGGSGYVVTPNVTISGGGGTGAAATTTISGGTVTAINFISPGSGYSTTPIVIIDAPPANILYATYWSNDGTSVNGSEPAAGVSVGVTNGLFTVVLGDSTIANMGVISASLFTQPNLQLQIWFNDGVNGYAALSPVQNLTPTPYADMANTASNLLGNLSAGQVTGVLANGTLPASPIFNGTVTATALAGNGAGVTNVNAASLGGVTATNFWQLGGNTVAAGQILGSTNNQAVELWVNNGRALRLQPTVGAPDLIGGAANNAISNNTTASVISGGSNNVIAGTADYSFIGAGNANAVFTNSDHSFIGSGLSNSIYASQSSVIGGGVANLIDPNSGYSFIGGGFGNVIDTNDSSSVIAGGGQCKILLGCNLSFIGGGNNNAIQNSADQSVIAGGGLNNIYEPASFIGGGSENNVYGDTSVIAGGDNNVIYGNVYTDMGSVVAGGDNNTIETNAYYSFLGGGYHNTIGLNGNLSVLVGGDYNTILAPTINSYETIVGGLSNSVSGVNSAIVGGSQNAIDLGSGFGFIGGGANNTINQSAQFSTIAGGVQNKIDVSAGAGAIGGGQGNEISINASFATIPGGFDNYVNNGANYSYAGGYYAEAVHPGSFVWADASLAQYTQSTNNNSWTVRSVGGARFITAVNGSGTPTAGVSLPAGGTAWATISDQNAKKNFMLVNGEDVLDKLATVPVERWNYKWEKDSDVPNIGPMAQAFKAAFYPGRDNKSITTLEFDGVELAAIQGLNQKLNDKDAEIQKLQKQLDDLQAMVKQLAARK